MNMIQKLVLSIVSALILISCGSSPENVGLTPLPSSLNEPSDEVLFEAVTRFIIAQGAPPNSVYDHERIDLNGDGARDGIILFKLPHTHWCGWDGCGMAIFQARGKQFSLVNTVSGVRSPIYVSNQTTNGWKDLILRVTGTNMPDKNVLMEFNGNIYPNTPMLARDLSEPLSSIQTTRLFSN